MEAILSSRVSLGETSPHNGKQDSAETLEKQRVSFKERMSWLRIV